MAFHAQPRRGMFTAWLTLALMTLLFAGCAPKQKEGISPMDNPWHHYAGGMQALEENDVAGAAAKFDRALHLTEEFAPALAGKSLVLAHGEASDKNTEMALKVLDEAVDAMDKEREKFIVRTTAIRIYAKLKSKGWLGKAQSAHHKAINIDNLPEADLPYYRAKEAADYFMAAAWFKYDFRKSEPLLQKVLGARSGGKWQPKADALYKRVQKISRAGANHTIGGIALAIAVKEQVTKGDLAAILVDELKLDRLFAGRIPIKSQLAKMSAEHDAEDLADNPFKSEIFKILKWNVRGLMTEQDPKTGGWIFKPEAPVSRKALALTLEDVLIKLLMDDQMATRWIGMDRSPYPDVAPTTPWFGAVQNVTTRNLMETDLSGEFRPNDPVDGAELLLAVFKLRNVINIH